MSPKRRRAGASSGSAGQIGAGQSGAGGLSDAKLAARTGRSAQAWFDLLDAEGATRMSHEQIVALLVDLYEAPEWGARAVAVRYQHDHGILLPGEQPDGTFRVAVSRSIRGSQSALLDLAIARGTAMTGHDPDEVHRTPDRTAAEWRLDPGSTVDAGHTLVARVGEPSVGGGGCAVSLVESGLRLPELVARVRRTLDRAILAVVADAAP